MQRNAKLSLSNGGTVRKLWVGEAHKYRDHLLRLDSGEPQQSVRGRRVADDFIADYVNLTLSLDSVVHGFFVNGHLRGAAELRMLGDPAVDGAEAAIAHRENLAKPRCRLGAAGAHRSLRRATAGVKHLHMTCLANNRRMQQLARKFEADLTFDFGSVVGEVEAPYPTPMSIWREAVADSHGFATAVLDAQTRFLRRA